MNKQEYIQRLQQKLSNLDQETQAEIIYDYEEHFQIGLDKGKTEEDIAQSLGAPELVASQYRFESAVSKAEQNPKPYNLMSAILTGIGLGLINMIFVLGIYLGFLGVLMGLFFSGIGVFASGLGVMVVSVLPSVPYWLSLPISLETVSGRVATLFVGLGTGAGGILLFIFTLKLAELTYRGTLAYVKTNISIVKKAGEIG